MHVNSKKIRKNKSDHSDHQSADNVRHQNVETCLSVDKESHGSRKKRMQPKKVQLIKKKSSGQSTQIVDKIEDGENLQNIISNNSESEIVRYYRKHSRIKDEAFANKLILKYNILSFKKQRILEELGGADGTGPQICQYLN